MTDIVINFSDDFFVVLFLEGINLAATKAKVDVARVLLDDIQLEEEDTETME